MFYIVFSLKFVLQTKKIFKNRNNERMKDPILNQFPLTEHSLMAFLFCYSRNPRLFLLCFPSLAIHCNSKIIVCATWYKIPNMSWRMELYCESAELWRHAWDRGAV